MRLDLIEGRQYAIQIIEDTVGHQSSPARDILLRSLLRDLRITAERFHGDYKKGILEVVEGLKEWN